MYFTTARGDVDTCHVMYTSPISRVHMNGLIENSYRTPGHMLSNNGLVCRVYVTIFSIGGTF